jgi:CRP-like cAMP-binding protein
VSSQHLVKNRILRQLSADELKSVQPWLTPVELRSNVVLHEPGDAMERVYFPLSGMISSLAVMQSGEAIETGIVGADGLVGGDAAINGHAFGQMTVQQDGAALTMPRAKFVDAYLAHPHLRNLVDRYQAILPTQARQNAACHALHSVRSRRATTSYSAANPPI